MHSFLDRLRFVLVLTSAALFVAAIVTSQANARERNNMFQPKRTPPSWYIGVSGSVDFVADADVRDYNVPSTANGTVSFDQGYGISGAVGYRPRQTQTLWDNIRVEGEVGYHQADLERFAFSTGGAAALSGDEYTLKTVMANMYVDFDASPSWRPYLGVGIGAGNVEINAGNLTSTDQDDTVMAYQGMAGITYIPQSFPLVELSAGYKYITTEDAHFVDASTGARIEMEYESHNLEAGARFYF